MLWCLRTQAMQAIGELVHVLMSRGVLSGELLLFLTGQLAREDMVMVQTSFCPNDLS